MQISDKVSQITPSASITIAQKVKEIKSQGTDVIGLHIGEPDFLPPKEALSSTSEALLNGKVRYSNVAGEPEVLTKFKENYNSQHGTNISEENLLISNGSNFSMFYFKQFVILGMRSFFFSLLDHIPREYCSSGSCPKGC